jgi:hypothetical protein
MSRSKNQTAGPTVRQQAEMSNAVKRARYELAAKNPTIVAKGKGAHVPAASVGQHFKVRARVTKMLDGTPTPDDIVKLSGMSDAAALRGIADWSLPGSAMAPLRRLAREFAGDPWAQGRYLAGILSVWVDELLGGETRRSVGAGPTEVEHQELGRYISEARRENVITTVRETSARIGVRLEVPEGTILAANGKAYDVNRDGFRLGMYSEEPGAGASVWVRFPSAGEIARIAHYDRGYRVHLRSKLVLTIARRRRA